MKFGTQAPADSTRPGSQDSTDGKDLGDKVHEQNTGELNRIGAQGTDAPNVDEQGNALPGTDANAALDSRAKLENDQSTDALDARLEQSKNLEEPGAKDKAQTYTSQLKSDPSAADLGLSLDVERNPVEQVLSESAAATAAHGTSDDDLTLYTSHPIQNLQVGPYHFEGTVLKLKPNQVDDFEKLLELLPMNERLNIGKIDTGRVDAIVASRQSAATQQFDSSAGKDALAQLQKNFPKLGTVPIDGPTAHANVSQTDNNVEIPLKGAE